MPIYEYTCDKCGKGFEALVFSAAGKVACPDCGSPKASRKFSVFSAHGGRARTPPCHSEGGCPGGMEGVSACQSGKCPLS
ncbi:MAG: zinc ribbon domain-containing protein [Planctomycetes bacterium]|nr:zinc ribbon domain-containing protein [Planctomycetota bacterium]